MNYNNFFILPSIPSPKKYIIKRCFISFLILFCFIIFGINSYFILFPMFIFNVILTSDLKQILLMMKKGKSLIQKDLDDYYTLKLYNVNIPTGLLKYKIIEEYKDFYFINFDCLFYRPKRILNLNYFFGISNRFIFYLTKYVINLYFFFGMYIFPILLLIIYFFISSIIIEKLLLIQVFIVILIISFILFYAIEKIFKIEYYFAREIL